jgi:transcriptional regulator with XRE-family HTH domain
MLRQLELKRFGNRVAELRELLELSQRDLAEKAGVSHGYISFIESARLERPGTKRLNAIARALGFDNYDHLMRGEEQDELGNPVSQANPEFQTDAEAEAWLANRRQILVDLLRSIPPGEPGRRIVEDQLDELPDWVLVEELEKGRSDSVLARVASAQIAKRDEQRRSLSRSEISLGRELRSLVGWPPWYDESGNRADDPKSVEIARRAIVSYERRVRQALRSEKREHMRQRLQEELNFCVADFVTDEASDGRSNSAWAMAARSLLQERGELSGQEQVRYGSLFPVYRMDSRGDPTRADEAPNPDHFETAPAGKETLIGPNGFAVLITSKDWVEQGLMVGDLLWVNPDLEPRPGRSAVIRLVNRGVSIGFGIVGFGTGPGEPEITTRYIVPSDISIGEVGSMAHHTVGTIVLVSRTTPPDVWAGRETGRPAKVAVTAGGFEDPPGSAWIDAADAPQLVREILEKNSELREGSLTITLDGRHYQFRDGRVMALISRPFGPQVDVVVLTHDISGIGASTATRFVPTTEQRPMSGPKITETTPRRNPTTDEDAPRSLH